jgi:hypothetical protein
VGEKLIDQLGIDVATQQLAGEDMTEIVKGKILAAFAALFEVDALRLG